MASGLRASGRWPWAWPLATQWPFIAILGVSWLVQEVEGILSILRWVAAGMFLVMGVLLIGTGKALGSDSRLTRPGMWAGYRGCACHPQDPKAILFYMGVLPGFFDLTQVTPVDIGVIVLVSILVPMAGNLALGAAIDRARRLLSSPRPCAASTPHRGPLIFVGLVIPFT